MTHPAVRHVADMATDIAWLARNLPTRLDTLAARTPDGWPTGRRSGGGQISRPTETAALAGLNPRSEHARITALAAEARGLVMQLVAAAEAVAVDVDTQSTQRQARCTGGDSDWADPACQRNAVTRDGLCDACRQRRDHWRRREPVT